MGQGDASGEMELLAGCYDSSQHGALRWKGIAVDKAGVVHGVTCGNSILYSKPI
ncbi:MAG: hypothetical protein H7X86_10985 [Gorillibacterium sp.]|nr:hypothetical protein [Gorillibacterium sp.]